MKMKFGAIIVDGRGKVGGHVASKNRFGAYLRTKVTPVNPKSPYQVGVRARLAGLSQDWRGLTPAQRLAWNSAVSDYKKTDIFGDIQNPTGFNLFVRLNSNLLNIGEAQQSAPPLPGSPAAITSASLISDVSDAKIEITFDPAVGADNHYIVKATPALSAGKSFVKSEYRQIDVLDNADASPVNLMAAWNAKFGSAPVAGQKVFVQLVPILDATGQAGLPYEVSAVTSA